MKNELLFTLALLLLLIHSPSLHAQGDGEVKIDGAGQDNALNQLGGSVTLGYQILPPLGAYINYGDVLASSNNANGQLFRVRVIFSYINVKKGMEPAEEGYKTRMNGS